MDNVTITLLDMPFRCEVEVLDNVCEECKHQSGYNIVITIPFREYPDYFIEKLCPGWHKRNVGEDTDG